MRPGDEDLARQFGRACAGQAEPRTGGGTGGLAAIVANCEDIFSTRHPFVPYVPYPEIFNQLIINQLSGMSPYTREDVERFVENHLSTFWTEETYPVVMGTYLSALVNVIGRPDEAFTLRLQDGGPKMDCLGNYLHGPTLVIHGHVGSHLGVSMRSGRIQLYGSAGGHAGMGMLGGVMEITRAAGDYLGSHLEGGTIRVFGSAGKEVGKQAKRGRIDIVGSYLSLADYKGYNLGASTIGKDVIITRNGEQGWP